MAERDVEPELSITGTVAVELFFDVERWRESGGFGPCRISLRLLSDYCQFTGAMLSLYEVQLIKLIDDKYMHWYAEGSKK